MEGAGPVGEPGAEVVGAPQRDGGEAEPGGGVERLVVAVDGGGVAPVRGAAPGAAPASAVPVSDPVGRIGDDGVDGGAVEAGDDAEAIAVVERDPV